MIKKGIIGKNGKPAAKEIGEAFTKMLEQSPLLYGELDSKGVIRQIKKVADTRNLATRQAFNYTPNVENPVISQLFRDCLQLIRYMVFYFVVIDQEALNFPQLDKITLAVKSRRKREHNKTEFEQLYAEAPKYLNLPVINVNAIELDVKIAWVLYGTLLNNFKFSSIELNSGTYKGVIGFINQESNNIANQLEYGGSFMVGPKDNRVQVIVPSRPLITSVLTSKMFRQNYVKILKTYGATKGTALRLRLDRFFNMRKVRETLQKVQDTF
jgi:hypothetical protein